MVYDLCYTPCTKRALNNEAVKYCVHCKQYLCDSCIHTHNSFTGLSGHVLVNPNSIRPTSSKPTGVSLQAMPTELCRIHKLELISLFCGEHDEVGCSICFTLNHKSCEDIHYVPKYAPDNTPPQLVKQVNKNLEGVIKITTKLQSDYGRLENNLDKSRADCKKEIDKCRSDINQILDQIETTTLSELDAKYKDSKKKITDKSQTLKDIRDDMVRYKAQVNSDQSNTADKFVAAKLIQALIKRSQDLMSESDQCKSSEMKFVRNTDIMNFLLGIITLGLINPSTSQDSSASARPFTARSKTTRQATPSTGPSATSPSTSNKQPKTQTPTPKPSTSWDFRTNTNPSTRRQDTKSVPKQQHLPLYKISDQSEYNISQMDDGDICSIKSSCITKGGIVLADYDNLKLKLVDRVSFKLKSSIELKFASRSVCNVSSTEIAVCLFNKTIQFVSVLGGKFKSVRSLSMDHRCRGIAVINDRMYVGGGDSLYIYTLEGEHVSTISEDTSGDRLFSVITDIAVSDDRQLLYVTDLDNGVITLTVDGSVQWQYKGGELNDPSGVCRDCVGNIFVCGRDSDNIVQFAPDGEFLGEVCTESDGIVNPLTVCYDPNSNKLITGMWRSDTISVFTIKR